MLPLSLLLISPAELDPILDDPNVIVVDTRSFQEYSQGHIPGAINLDLFAFHWIDTTRQGIDSFTIQAQNLLSFIGVTSEKRVIFYDNVSGMLAARGVWMSMYLSHHDTMILDGGLTKWKQDGLLLETKSNSLKPSQFKGDVNPEIISGFEYLKENLDDDNDDNDDVIIIDARLPQEYDGTTVRAANGGHIPGAVNIDWSENINSEDGTFKNDKELAAVYNYPKDSKIITYCHGAYRAANTFLVLKKLGFKHVRVYLGSWGEWGNRTELPAEK